MEVISKTSVNHTESAIYNAQSEEKKTDFFRSKWFIHGAVLLLLIFFPIITAPLPFDKRITFLPPNHPNIDFKTFFISADLMFYRLIFMGIYTTCIYLANVLYFVPQLLIKQKIRYFIWSIIICTLGSMLGNILLNYFFMGHLFFNYPPNINLNIFDLPKLISPFMVIPMIAVYSIGTGIEMTIEWFKKDKLQQTIVQEKLEAELALLKFQINPHFLFNTLNNIYALAEDKSDQTQSAVLLLSNLLRYAIYDSNVEKIHLSREIEQIKNYIELQNFRISSKKDIQIHFEIVGKIENQQIAPMLLLPFIENAFKYGISYLSHTQIIIKLVIETNRLSFWVMNQKMKSTINEVIEDYKGLGLKNVKRRLDLIYPNHHNLTIDDNGNFYEVKLEINNL